MVEQKIVLRKVKLEENSIFILLSVNYKKPKAGWTPTNYKYMGPFNPLDIQIEYDPETGEITRWIVPPFNKVDEISAHHDVCYSRGVDKNECDRKMVSELDKIPYGNLPKIVYVC